MPYQLRNRTMQPYNDVNSECDSSDDSDYLPEEEDEEEEIDITILGKNYRSSSTIFVPIIQKSRETMNSKIQYSEDEKKYLKQLEKTQQKELADIEQRIQTIVTKDSVPLRFKILNSSLDERSKQMILYKLEHLNQMSDQHSEYFKLKNWIHNVYQLPIQKYYQLPVTHEHPIAEIQQFIQHTKHILDTTVYGHTDAKNQILRIIAQWISNPNSHGHCIGIQGSMGTGKTSLVKEGISKALGIPFGFITLGGASDGSFLEGHSFTYEGSTYGKISEVLIKTQCMNPIIFFDELDKVSATKKGEEVIGVLTHLTDSSQNKTFNDRYFGEIDLDLSRALIVFSYNDETLINPILKDRLITIQVKGYSIQDKCTIATEYLIPKLLVNYGFNHSDILFSTEIIQQIIQNVPCEEGVRNLKRGIECIISWINMYRYIPDQTDSYNLPYTVTTELVAKFVKINDSKPLSMYT